MSDARARGLVLGLAAYSTWGFFPLFFHLLAHVPPMHVLTHRALWSCVFTACVLTALGNWGRVRASLGDARQLGMLTLSALFIAANWLVFIWSVANGQVLASSLGYFTSPLVSVLLGVAFLRERLTRLEIAAVALAALAVANEIHALGALPLVTLTLAVTFALYGLMRKQVPVEALTGLFVETLLLMPFLAVYVAWETAQGRALWSGYALPTQALLMISGVLTALPLIAFAAAARRLGLVTLGMLMYVNPTLQMVTAVWLFDEPMRPGQWASFALIWLGLALYSWNAALRLRAAQSSARASG